LYYNWNLQGWVTTGSDSRMTLLGYNLWRGGSNFQFVAVPDTSYTDVSVPPGTYNYYISAVYDEAESFTDGPAAVTIPASGNLKGLVYDGVSLNPVAQATVTLQPGGYTTQTTDDGKYFLTDIPWGNYTLAATQAGYNMGTAKVVVDSLYQVADIALFSSGSLLLLPFDETWDQGSFNTHYWWFEPGPGNWTVSLQAGNPKPAAEFLWLPALQDYSFVFTSPNLDAVGVSQHVVLEFDLFLSMYNATGQEYLTTELWDGTGWITVAVFKNDGDIYWEHHVYDITSHAWGRVTQIRFIAHGSNSSDINSWGIDNIAVHEQEGVIVDGTVTNADTGDPIEGAMVSIPGYDPVYTDVQGFYSIEVIEGTYDITYSADGYLPLTDSSVNVTGATHHDVALEPEPCNPPRNLTYEIINGDVYLYWDPPENGSMILFTPCPVNDSFRDFNQRIDNLSLTGYNIYRDGVQINTYPVIGNQFIQENPGIGLYTFCVSAIWTLCESESVCIDVLVTGINDLMNESILVFPVPAGDFINVEVSNEIRELSVINYTGQVVYEQEVGVEKSFRINTSDFRSGSYLIKFISDTGYVITRKMLIIR
jgi:hypothetical protein